MPSWSVRTRLVILRSLIEAQGFEVLDGDFVRRDGSHSPYHLMPVNPARLMDRAMAAFSRVRMVPLPPPDDDVTVPPDSSAGSGGAG